MAAPLFEEKEVQRILRMPKRTSFDDWQGDHKARHGSSAQCLKCLPVDDDERVTFQIEFETDERSDSISMTLFVQYPPRGRPIAICRYDIQRLAHRNPPWFSPRKIKPREPHRHVYNPRAVSEGFATDWSNCAESLNLPLGGSTKQQMERMKRRFLDDLNIAIENPDTSKILF